MMMNILFSVILCMLAASIRVAAECETFTSSCPIALGQSLHYTFGINYVKLGADDDYYVTFTMPVDTQTVSVDLSVMFGNVRIFCAVNRKPTPVDHDYANAFSANADHLSISPTAHTAADKFNVLIKAAPTSTVFMVGAITTGTKALQMAVNGMPQSVRLGRGSSLQVQFPVVSTAPVNVLATAYSASLPSMTLLMLPSATATVPVALPSSVYNNDSDVREGFLSFTPRASDVGKTFVLQLLSQNMSYVSLVLRTGIEKGSVIGFAAKDPPVLGYPTHTLVLQSGQPQKDRVGNQQERYYVFYVPAGISGSITITVDPVQGDSDLFVNPSSRGIYHSQGTDPLPVWSSMRASGIDTVTIAAKDRDFVSTGGAYFITVFGYDAAQFMVRVTAQDTATVLVEGYTIQDSVLKGQYKYYRYHDTAPTVDIMFDLLPTVGDADMMIGCVFRPTNSDAGYPSKLHYNYTSQMYLEDSILISPTDTNSCSLGSAGDDSTHRGEGGVFYVAVYGYSDSTYMLSAQHMYGERTLVAGVPTAGIVYRTTQQRYRVRVGYEAEELRILLSPLFGDADLYVRMNAAPDLTNYDYNSRNFNTIADSVVISEENICDDCWVHILVYGFATTEYSLLATFSDGTVMLTNGVPQRGSVASNGVEYYNYQATAACTVTVVATFLSGTPSLYLSKTVEYPDSTTADTTSYVPDSGSGFVPKITLPNVAAGQALHLGVAGMGHNVTYTIRVFETYTDAALPPVLLTLPSGMPQEDSIPSTSNGWLYYQVSVPIGHETITVRTSMEAGYVELYILKCATTSAYQCSVSSLPNSTHYTLTTADTDRSFINIYRNDVAPALYVLGVYSQSFYSAYLISANLYSSTLSLQSGVSVMDHVSKGEVDYFAFYMDQAYVKLKIALTTLSGDPDIFVSTTVEHPQADDTNSTWRSTEYGADVLVIDPRTDRRACVHCMYYIAVVGRAESTYTISASTSSNLPKLVDGLPTTGAVAYLEWVYYSFNNVYGSTRDLHVNLVTATGNADLYVTLDGSIPTFLNSAYSSANWYSNDGIDILHTDAAYARCTTTSTATSGSGSNCNIIVGVYGSIVSEYTLTLTSSSAATMLQLDTVRTDTIPLHQSRYYRLLLSQGSLAPYTLRFLVTPFSGHVQLFVSCDTMLPNATNYQWSVTPDTGSGSFVDILSVAAADKGCARVNAQYYASVYADTAASYSIQASIVGNSTVPLLVPGFAHTAVVAQRSFDYYFVRPGTSSDDLRLLATVIQGDVDIYVSYTYDTRARISNGAVVSYALSSAKSGSEDMTIKHSSIQAACANRVDCYFIVAVLSTNGASRYSIMALTPDSTIQLSSGVPRQSHVDSTSYEYFKFTLTQPDLDVIVSVTPISGDPDLFIGVAPITHPSRQNFTWFQSKFGADTMTLQYSEVSKHCNLLRVGHCDIYIGVYGWMNTTFTVLATVDEGFLSPVTLIDQAPQSGFVATSDYSYYKYSISVPQGSGGEELPPVDIKFTLTPTDDGDADLFLLIEKKGNRTEPGASNYDYRSVGWGSVTELITLSVDMPLYCFDCTVYLAVYGYRACAYTIQASSSGVIELQAGQAIGGHVSNEKFSYYSIHNRNQFGMMKFTLTMISEDADLYIVSHKHGAAYELPSRTHYTWRSLYVGSDVLSIDYQDPHYCSDCDYIVGVYGYHNSTYTLMVTDTEDSIIKLVQNRPQIAAINARDGTLFFSAVIASSIADTTVTLTSLDNGQADLYVQVYNAEEFNSPSGGDIFRLPDPDVPGSYAYSTHNSQNDHVFLPGPHNSESILVVAVKALSAVRFSIVATSSQSPVLLLSGQPQNHYVGFGVNEYFKFYPHGDEDLHITLTARSGDPDLFVSTVYEKPHCARVTNTYYTNTVCSNYTWSSRNYMTDQLILSRDSPCSAVMPGTSVTLDCDPEHSYNPSSGEPVYIGVYGYAAAQFTLLVAPEGQSIELFPGQPQLYRTSPGYICNTRSPSTGACKSSAASNKKVEVAYFSFRINAPADSRHKQQLLGDSFGASSGAGSLQSVYDVVLSVLPSCNTSRLPDSSFAPLDTCAPGCDCAPLTMYVNSCPLSKCTPLDRKPSELVGQHKATHVVKAGGSSLVLSANKADGGGGSYSFCDPTAAGEDCAYFIAVVAAPLPSSSPNVAARLESAAFTITARTPGDMILIPCVADGNPDGIQFRAEDSIIPRSVGGQTQLDSYPFHYYELCSQRYTDTSLSADNLIVELEQCSGSTVLYACADSTKCDTVLPTAQSWAYYADTVQSCSHSFDPRIRDSCISAVRGRPTLTLPQRNGNYFLMTNGTGKFEVSIQNTVGATRRSPVIVLAGMQSKEAAAVKVSQVTGNTVSLQWQQARVLMPGAMNSFVADYMSYSAYIFDTRATDAALTALAQKGIKDIRFSSKCGLNYATQVLPPSASNVARALLKSTEQGADFMTHTLEHLVAKTNYRVVIIATCDAACLRQLSKVTTDPHVLISCSDSKSGDCKPQSSVYISVEFMTGDRDDGTTRDDDMGAGDNDDGYVGFMVAFSSAVMTLLTIALIGLSIYWLKNNGAEMYAWLAALASGSGGGMASFRRTWAATDNEEGDEDISSVNSAHGLTGRPTAPAASGGRSFLGLRTPTMGRSAGKRDEDGVELEDYIYTPPSINNSRASRAGAPIDFRGEDHGQGKSSVADVLSGAASKIMTAAGSALNSASSSVDAWNPLHKDKAGAASGGTSYSPLGGRQQQSAAAREEPELHL